MAIIPLGFVFVTGCSTGLKFMGSRVTFTRDVAPVLFENCAPCHHPGGPGPFSVLTYNEVRSRARQIAEVTARHYMPPWPPEPGYGDFLGARRLSPNQIALLRRWVDQGTPQGQPENLPTAPEFGEGWQLGKPDMVLRMEEPYTLSAEGTDVFRNFVLPVPVSRTRYVKALEMIPGNKRIVHHANILIDRTQSARRRDASDPGVGFGGMDVAIESDRFEPESHFLFWKPGTPPYTESEDMAWEVDRTTDLVLNMHLQPSGKPEIIQAQVGLYFTARPPTKHPILLQLEHDGALFIAPGEKDFEVTDSFELPVDVDLLGVYPHAHYLGHRIEGWAVLPDGARKWLILIKDWDLNWQAVYRYVHPVFLPRGTRLSMRFTYDNSEQNPRNPNHPPRTVKGGDRTVDEMGHLWLQFLPRDEKNGREILQESIMRHRLDKYPDEFSSHFNLAAVLQSRGRLGEAVEHYEVALRLKPGDPMVLNGLGSALEASGKGGEAAGKYRAALLADPEYTDARYNLSRLLLSRGKVPEAIGQFELILKTHPDDGDVHNDLGSALAMSGRRADAKSHFENALRVNPDHPLAHGNLAAILVEEGNYSRAVAEYEAAVRLNPADADIQAGLGKVLLRLHRILEAVEHFEQALRLNPGDAGVQEQLRKARHGETTLDPGAMRE